jgi:hypothetical protein
MFAEYREGYNVDSLGLAFGRLSLMLAMGGPRYPLSKLLLLLSRGSKDVNDAAGNACLGAVLEKLLKERPSVRIGHVESIHRLLYKILTEMLNCRPFGGTEEKVTVKTFPERVAVAVIPEIPTRVTTPTSFGAGRDFGVKPLPPASFDAET